MPRYWSPPVAPDGDTIPYRVGADPRVCPNNEELGEVVCPNNEEHPAWSPERAAEYRQGWSAEHETPAKIRHKEISAEGPTEFLSPRRGFNSFLHT